MLKGYNQFYQKAIKITFCLLEALVSVLVILTLIVLGNKKNLAVCIVMICVMHSLRSVRLCDYCPTQLPCLIQSSQVTSPAYHISISTSRGLTIAIAMLSLERRRNSFSWAAVCCKGFWVSAQRSSEGQCWKQRSSRKQSLTHTCAQRATELSCSSPFWGKWQVENRRAEQRWGRLKKHMHLNLSLSASLCRQSSEGGMTCY